MKRTIVIGDIHGCYYTLNDLLEECGATPDDRYVFVGDYIDRGPYGCQVVDRLLAAQSKMGKDKFVLLRGNHEQLAIDGKGYLTVTWKLNGGADTIQSYKKGPIHLLTRHIEAFKKMPLYCDIGQYIVCHAGFSQPKLADNTEYDLLWDSDWIESDYRPREKFVIFGHTPHENAPFSTHTLDIGIDGGCVFGGNLCAVVVDDETGAIISHKVPQNEKDKGTP